MDRGPLLALVWGWSQSTSGSAREGYPEVPTAPDQVPGLHRPASTRYEELYLNNKQFTIPWFPALSKVTKHMPVEMMCVSHDYLSCRHFHSWSEKITFNLVCAHRCVGVYVSQRTCKDQRTSLHVNPHLAPRWKWGLLLFTPAQTRLHICKTPEILLPPDPQSLGSRTSST